MIKGELDVKSVHAIATHAYRGGCEYDEITVMRFTCLMNETRVKDPDIHVERQGTDAFMHILDDEQTCLSK